MRTATVTFQCGREHTITGTCIKQIKAKAQRIYPGLVIAKVHVIEGK